MKKVFTISTAVVTIMFNACNNSSPKPDSATSGSSSQTFNLDTTKLKAGDTFYQCEMHPEVLSDNAGNCPKCGMELTEMEKN